MKGEQPLFVCLFVLQLAPITFFCAKEMRRNTEVVKEKTPGKA